jgi:urease accessory protein
MLHEQPLKNERSKGLLRLKFDHRVPINTVLTVCQQQPPLQVVRAFPLHDGAALVHLHNISGGVLGGDQLQLSVDVGAHARVQLTSTGATRLYRSRNGLAAAIQTTEITVGSNGLLEYLPDPLIPFAGAHYRQATRIELAAGAGLFWWDILAPGRAARGEQFEYELLQITLDIVASGQLIASERVKLQPSLRPLASPGRFGPYRYVASFYICRVDWVAMRWLALEEQLNQLARNLTRPGDVLWGISTLPAHGLVVRAMSSNGRALLPGLLTFWRAAKLALYGQEAIPPRKVY